MKLIEGHMEKQEVEMEMETEMEMCQITGRDYWTHLNYLFAV